MRTLLSLTVKKRVSDMEKVKIWIEAGSFPPIREHATDAGLDLRVKDSVYVKPGRQLIHTGVHVALPANCVADVRPRSGFSSKGFNDGFGIRHDADVLYGTVDPGYTGEVCVIVKSCEKYPFLLKAGTAIAQLVIIHGVANDGDIQLVSCCPDEDTDRGDKGFCG